MKRCFLIIALFLSVFSVSQAQSLNWHLTAQAGTANYSFENFQGSLLAGFKTTEGQQLSIGPVVKGYNINTNFTNTIGGRIYSQVKMLSNVSIYMQCDVFGGVRSASSVQFAQQAATRSPMRLETGAGLIYTYRETIGLSAGYNIGELNPISGMRKNTPSIKLIYLMPLTRNW